MLDTIQLFSHRLFITGAAGYVGYMLVEEFSRRDDVEKIIALDKEPIPESFKTNPKVVYVQKNTNGEWNKEVAKYSPDIVIHTAWQIDDIYGQSETQHSWNILGSDKVFDFVFADPSVKRFLHFSTSASYGAFWGNTIEHRFTEEEPFRKSVYRYAEEKRVSEEHLRQKYEATKRNDITIAIFRPAAITGPRGRFSRGINFPGRSSSTMMTSFVPAAPKWARQVVHEDDVVDIVELLAFSSEVKGYEAYNLCPPGEPVLASDIAKAVGKRVIPIPPQLVRVAFFFFWHLSRGRVKTCPGAWRSYSYPVMVDGSKITKKLGYKYRILPKDAYFYTDGRYEFAVPEKMRKAKPQPSKPQKDQHLKAPPNEVASAY